MLLIRLFSRIRRAKAFQEAAGVIFYTAYDIRCGISRILIKVHEELAKKEKLLKEHQRHIEDNKSLAETLDKEILLLEELKCKKIDE